MHWPLSDGTFEASQSLEEPSLIRLNRNENAYRPSTRVTDSIKSAIGRANRYPRMEYTASIDSHANFVMMNTLHPATEVIQHSRKNNTLIGRCFPPMDTYIRISLGRQEEMLAFWRTWDKLPYAKNMIHH